MKSIIVLILILIFCAPTFAGEIEWLSENESGRHVLVTYDSFAAKQNVTCTGDTTVAISLIPDGGYAAQITYYGNNTSGGTDTLWIYSPSVTAAPTSGDSVYVLCPAGTVTSTGVLISEGSIFRFGKASTGTPDLLIEGTGW